MSTPDVSIIVPAYNTAAFIGDTLESIFAQTRDGYEVIVINDGAPDTEAIEQAIEPYRSQIEYIVQENRGLAGARNTGLEAARGEYVAFLDSDDAWLPNYMEVQLGMLEADPEIDVLYPNAVTFGEGPHAGKLAMDLSPSEGPATFTSIVRKTCNVRVYATARRSEVVRAGGFDETLRSSEDFDLWLRMAKQGSVIRYHREPLVRYRVRPDSLSADPVWMAEHNVKVLQKCESLPDLSDEERRALAEEQERYEAYATLYRAKKAFAEGRTEEAREGVKQANAFFRGVKLAAVTAALRIAPNILLRLYRLRESHGAR